MVAYNFEVRTLNLTSKLWTYKIQSSHLLHKSIFKDKKNSTSLIDFNLIW